jgi:hypothetical protein
MPAGGHGSSLGDWCGETVSLPQTRDGNIQFESGAHSPRRTPRLNAAGGARWVSMKAREEL